jgi:N utilization substance protein B
MISRRLLRIKVLQGIYSYQRDGEMELDHAVKLLQQSIEEVHDLYLYVLSFPAEMQAYLQSESDAEKEKYFPNQETLRAANIFRSNKIVEKIESAVAKTKFKHLKSLDWKKHGEFMLSLFPVLRMQSFVRDYLVFEDPTFEQKREFMKQFFNFLFFEYKSFKEVNQEDYLNWKVDMNPVRKAIIRTLATMTEDEDIELAPLSNSIDTDMNFAINLLKYTIVENDDLEALLASNTPNWDVDRIAAIDFILLKMGIIEFTKFPDVPVKVTINEYLEISKDFSTPNSSRFVNGVLDKLRIRLTNEGSVTKEGRGLWQ